jgi:phage tail sheath gpL-like
MISNPQLPANLRYPGAYISIDGSQAGLGGDIPGVLLVGKKFASGTAAVGEISRAASVQDVITQAGAGSMLAQMAKRYRAIDPALDLYLLPFVDDLEFESQARGSIAVMVHPSGVGRGTIALYIAGHLISVTDQGQHYANAQSIIDAINTTVDIPVIAALNPTPNYALFTLMADGTYASGAPMIDLVSKHAGDCGNDIDVRLNLYGEASSAQGLSITPMENGSGSYLSGAGNGNSASYDLPTILGQRWYRYVALGLNDAQTLQMWSDEAKRRYLPPIQAGFRAFAAHRGDYASAAAFGETKNYEHIADLSLGINPTTPWEAAAMVCAAAAPRLVNNPTESLEGTPLPGMIGANYHDWTQANSLLYKGMSIMQVAKDGSCSIKRLISMYQFRPDGSSDDAYLDINTAETMERIRYEQRIGAIQRFTGTAAAKSNEGYRPGLRITTIDDVRAYLLSTYQNKLMKDFGWVQDYARYKATLVVEQDSQNPSRFNFKDEPVLLSPYYILAGLAQFRKAV